jgi:hypothetical protein
MRQQRRGRVLGPVFLLALAGCAASSVQPQMETSAVNLPRPSMVLVYRFAVNLNDVQENQSVIQKAIDASATSTPDERLAETAHEVADAFADELVTKIIGFGLPAQRATAATYVPQNAVIIVGNFVDIDEGNRLRRLVIGFGAGKAQIDTQAQVLYATAGGNRTLTEFTTHTDSGEMPGAAVTMGAGAAAQGGLTAGMAAANVALGGVKAYRSQIAGMATRSADKAAQFLGGYFAQQGWIAPVNQPLL